MDILLPISLTEGEEDKWRWLEEKCNSYSVKSAYFTLIKGRVDGTLEQPTKQVLQQIWKAPIQSKFQVLTWRILLNAVPTRTELKRRGVLKESDPIFCVLCGSEEETIEHLFFKCHVVQQLWERLRLWCGIGWQLCG